MEEQGAGFLGFGLVGFFVVSGTVKVTMEVCN